MHNLNTSANLSLQRYVWCTSVQPHRLRGPPATENEEKVGPLEGRRLVGTSLQCQPIRQNDVDENGRKQTHGFAVGRGPTSTDLFKDVPWNLVAPFRTRLTLPGLFGEEDTTRVCCGSKNYGEELQSRILYSIHLR